MTVGTPPGTGPQLIDSAWLIGLSGGQNQTFNSTTTALTAATQGAGPIPTNVSLIEIDSSVNTGSLTLPNAVAGTEITIINNTANALNLFASAVTNLLTGALDTINALANGTALSLAANQSVTWVACAKNGKWFTK